MKIEVQDIYREATKCNSCFENFKIARGKVRKAQPRWIGNNYFSADRRICVIAINPGNVGTKFKDAKKKAASQFDKTIKNFGKGQSSWKDVMNFIDTDMKNWGEGRYKKFYFDLMNLPIDEVAMINMMLCSATEFGKQKNYYNENTLRNCFNKHTRELIQALNPDVCILSGTILHKYSKFIREFLPHCKFKKTYHFRPKYEKDWPKADEDAERIARELFGCSAEHRN